MWDLAIGRTTTSISSEITTNATQAASSLVPATSTTAAPRAPTANGARKNEVVSISPTPKTQAAITHNTHPDIVWRAYRLGARFRTLAPVRNGRSAATSACANSPGSNGLRSSSFSPTPISFTGMPSSWAIASAIPPLAVPSSLVSTSPVDVHGLGEHPGLAQAVLPGGGVDRQQGLVRAPRGSAWRSPGVPWPVRP